MGTYLLVEPTRFVSLQNRIAGGLLCSEGLFLAFSTASVRGNG